MSGVYKITNPEGAVYIGASKNINDRWSRYRSLKCKMQRKLYMSLKKHGHEKHVFEVLELCDNDDDLRRKEYAYGLKFKVLSKDNLNSRLPKVGDSHYHMASETKKRIGDANRGRSVGRKHNFYPSVLKKLTVADVLEVKRMLNENVLTHREIASIYNVTKRTIGSINTGDTYSYVKVEDTSRDLNFKIQPEHHKDILQMRKDGDSQRKIAERYNVTQGAISRLLKRIS